MPRDSVDLIRVWKKIVFFKNDCFFQFHLQWFSES